MFVRPSRQSINLLKAALRNPRFGEYTLYFSNVVNESDLQELADADEGELVTGVHEFFADFNPLDELHFAVTTSSLSGGGTAALLAPSQWDPNASQLCVERATSGLCAALLALKRRPVVRYASQSETARRVASGVARAIESDPVLYDFRAPAGSGAPVLLVLDRRDDPVTPLLSQWTYQAMLHEVIGMENNTLDLKKVGASGPKELGAQLLVAASSDDFFRSNMYENYGDLGANVKTLVDEFQSKTKSNQNISSIEDMQRFVDSYPEFRKLSGNVSKHVALMSELSRLIDERHLMAVSQQEQELACSDGQSAAYEGVLSLLSTHNLREQEKLRLVMLFGLRYERSGSAQLRSLLERLEETGVPRRRCGLVRTLVQIAGAAQRTGDLYGDKSFFGRAAGSVARGLRGVDNVYTQHVPALAGHVDGARKGKLKETEFPFAGAAPPAGATERPSEVIVFIVGGSTYEEARWVATNQQGGRCVLGGTGVLNSQDFLAALDEVSASEQRYN